MDGISQALAGGWIDFEDFNLRSGKRKIRRGAIGPAADHPIEGCLRLEEDIDSLRFLAGDEGVDGFESLRMEGDFPVVEAGEHNVLGVSKLRPGISDIRGRPGHSEESSVGLGVFVV
jgi:hypothetical protein